MSEIFLDCDSPCVSCPFNRIFKIGNFNGRHLRGSYYCVNDGILYLCKRGVGFRMVKGQLRPFCPRCDRELGQIILSYNQGKDFRPFEDDILLVVRIPLQSRFDITKVLRGSYFKDLSENRPPGSNSQIFQDAKELLDGYHNANRTKSRAFQKTQDYGTS